MEWESSGGVRSRNRSESTGACACDQVFHFIVLFFLSLCAYTSYTSLAFVSGRLRLTSVQTHLGRLQTVPNGRLRLPITPDNSERLWMIPTPNNSGRLRTTPHDFGWLRLPITPDNSERFRMTSDDTERLRMTTDDSNSQFLRKIPNDSGWPRLRMTLDDSERTQTTPDDCGRLRTIPNYSV